MSKKYTANRPFSPAPPLPCTPAALNPDPWPLAANLLPTCILCDTPTPATHLAGDWELCAAHYNAITAPDPVCAECGEPLSSADLEAGETACAGCTTELTLS